jgi:hypothetical protein
MKTEDQITTTTSQTLLDLQDLLAVDYRQIIQQAIDAIELESVIADSFERSFGAITKRQTVFSRIACSLCSRVR